MKINKKLNQYSQSVDESLLDDEQIFWYIFKN